MTHTILPCCHHHHLPCCRIALPSVLLSRNLLFQHLHRYLLLHHLIHLVTTKNGKSWKMVTGHDGDHDDSSTRKSSLTDNDDNKLAAVSIPNDDTTFHMFNFANYGRKPMKTGEFKGYKKKYYNCTDKECMVLVGRVPMAMPLSPSSLTHGTFQFTQGQPKSKLSALRKRISCVSLQFSAQYSNQVMLLGYFHFILLLKK